MRGDSPEASRKRHRWAEDRAVGHNGETSEQKKARHGTYPRLTPPGTQIARWYCPTGHHTFSLLLDCLAASILGTLAEVEAVVHAVGQAPCLEAACRDLRPEIQLPGVLRWVRRIRTA